MKKLKLTDEDIERAIGAVKNGSPLVHVSAAFGIHTSTLRNYLRRQGVMIPKVKRDKENSKEIQSLSSIQRELVREVLSNGPVDPTEFARATARTWVVVWRSLQHPVFAKEPDGYHLNWTLRSWWDGEAQT